MGIKSESHFVDGSPRRSPADRVPLSYLVYEDERLSYAQAQTITIQAAKYVKRVKLHNECRVTVCAVSSRASAWSRETASRSSAATIPSGSSPSGSAFT